MRISLRNLRKYELFLASSFAELHWSAAFYCEKTTRNTLRVGLVKPCCNLRNRIFGFEQQAGKDIHPYHRDILVDGVACFLIEALLEKAP